MSAEPTPAPPKPRLHADRPERQDGTFAGQQVRPRAADMADDLAALGRDE
jgi:hypothetical protein